MEFAILATLIALSTAYSVYNSVQTGLNQKKMYEYNAAVQRQQAEAAQKEAEYKAERIRQQGEMMRGKQRVAFLASGVTLEGTPMDVLDDTTRQNELGALAILYSGSTARSALEASASLKGTQASQSVSAGYAAAGQSLLSGATSLYKAYKMPDILKSSKTTDTYDIPVP